MSQRVVLLNLPDTKVNPNCLLFHRARERDRQRERENRRSPVVRGGREVRWCLENIQHRSVQLIWIIEGQGSFALAVGAGGGRLDIFFSRLSFLFSFSLFGRRPDID